MKLTTTLALMVSPLALFTSVALFFSPAYAQQASNCAPRELVLVNLAEKYGETRQAIGVLANGNVMEIIASNETGSFSVLSTNAAGISCLVASGQNYETLTESLPPAGIDG